MAVNEPVLLLLKMVRSEEMASYPDLVECARRSFPGHRVIWATTAQGARLLAANSVGVEVLELCEGGFSALALRSAVARMRAAAPSACLIAYENPRRTGNLMLELLALSSGARRLYMLADGSACRPVGRGRLALRVLAGMGVAVALSAAALVMGGLLACMLPLAAFLYRSFGPRGCVDEHGSSSIGPGERGVRPLRG
ncbi:MAG TPA: hypothetical protein PLZ94_12350 [Armatimonadota bacterium]|jgi:hypothetical protein|nr:hypothetical protein [Armatimonadota bacterium]